MLEPVWSHRAVVSRAAIRNTLEIPAFGRNGKDHNADGRHPRRFLPEV